MYFLSVNILISSVKILYIMNYAVWLRSEFYRKLTFSPKEY